MVLTFHKKLQLTTWADTSIHLLRVIPNLDNYDERYKLET